MSDMDIVEVGRKAAANIAEQGINGWGNTMSGLCDEVDWLRTQLAAAQKDAERYRFMRDGEQEDEKPFIARRFGSAISRWTGEHADEAIDQAMQDQT